MEYFTTLLFLLYARPDAPPIPTEAYYLQSNGAIVQPNTTGEIYNSIIYEQWNYQNLEGECRLLDGFYLVGDCWYWGFNPVTNAPNTSR